MGADVDAGELSTVDKRLLMMTSYDKRLPCHTAEYKRIV